MRKIFKYLKPYRLFAVIAMIYMGGNSIANGMNGTSTGNIIIAAVSCVTQVIVSIMVVTMMFQSVLAFAKRLREMPVDGLRVKDCKLEAFCKKIAFVLQQSELFSGSVA